MSSGLRLFLQAERSYAGGRVDDTLSYYTKAITKILKSETLLAPLPPTFSHPAVPQEVLGVVWHNFAGFFRDPILKRTRENSPEAYKLLSSFRPNSHHEFQRFSTEQEKTYLAGMRISAGLTLALMAWDERDRATAAKRYRDAIEPDARKNLTALLKSDERLARCLAEVFGMTGAGEHRREVLGIGIIRIEGDGRITFSDNPQVASDRCKACGKRDAKLMKCSACKSVTYCSADCQKANWRDHKARCKELRASST
ncbi:hypothetical protein CC1G_05984 [Coprinopsis cinerea okayama7|uniref:MYND-type domain-containing protein n=1 Tax=Coprinopsis cinerea (strain Okayama-7 / 130 / ATCC MYA-4618 / FGSC 9003) TaxID=240176 RepID=A8N4K6_COPC7|nr:hypothetical protein CC1G_05984 [Coprinopsis cinerea okayama7\|eukprot:XP_001829775.1 hypothetical protein CC1G_05984 [Coprinopsis cinerea okayama7\